MKDIKKRKEKIIRLLLALISLFAVLVILPLCGVHVSAADDEAHSINILCMDTFMTLTAYGDNADDALSACEEELFRLESLLSTEDPESEIYKLNDKRSLIVSDETAKLIGMSANIRNITEGGFDPSVYPLVRAWGFTGDEKRVPDAEEIEDLLKITSFDLVSFDQGSSSVSFLRDGIMIDFGGIAKGYAASKVMDIFDQFGVSSAVISLGGNVGVKGTKPDGTLWKVAVRDPFNPSGFAGIIETSDNAVVTSGGYERFFEEDGVVYHHIIDPSTGYPAKSGLSSVTIVAKDPALADGLSTGLYVMGLERAVSLWRDDTGLFEAVFVTDDKEVFITKGLKDHFVSDLMIHVVEP